MEIHERIRALVDLRYSLSSDREACVANAGILFKAPGGAFLKAVEWDKSGILHLSVRAK